MRRPTLTGYFLLLSRPIYTQPQTSALPFHSIHVLPYVMDERIWVLCNVDGRECIWYGTFDGEILEFIVFFEGGGGFLFVFYGCGGGRVGGYGFGGGAGTIC